MSDSSPRAPSCFCNSPLTRKLDIPFGTQLIPHPANWGRKVDVYGDIFVSAAVYIILNKQQAYNIIKDCFKAVLEKIVFTAFYNNIKMLTRPETA